MFLLCFLFVPFINVGWGGHKCKHMVIGCSAEAIVLKTFSTWEAQDKQHQIPKPFYDLLALHAATPGGDP